jgi:DNA-binding MarR family transcriptional regulator
VYDAALRPAGLAMNQFTLLVAIHLFEAVPITQLAQVLFTDQTTVTRNIKLLEKRGLVVINPGADRRIAIAIFPFTSQKAITMGYHSRSWVAFLNPTYKLAITLK